MGVGEDNIVSVNISPKLKNFHTMRWLRGWCYDKAKKEYLLNDEEIRQTLELESIFKNFDADKSGTLDKKEILQMFKENHINISKGVIQELFKFSNSSHAGTLTLEEFKALLCN